MPAGPGWACGVLVRFAGADVIANNRPLRCCHAIHSSAVKCPPEHGEKQLQLR